MDTLASYAVKNPSTSLEEYLVVLCPGSEYLFRFFVW
jgi:hypothetical protein